MKKMIVLFLAVSCVLISVPFAVQHLQNTAQDGSLQTESAQLTDGDPTDAIATQPAQLTDEKAEEIAVCMASSGAVVSMPLEEYVIGVVAGEMPALYEEEALKAQAAASMNLARIALQNGTSDRLAGGHISSSPSVAQAYLTQSQMQEKWGSDYEVFYNRIADAVQAVAGFEIVYEDELCQTCFHAVSPGKTENSENVWLTATPYLTAVDSSFDTTAQNFTSAMQLHADAFADGLSAFGFAPETNARHWLGESTYSPSGTLLSLEVGNITVTGQQLREAFGLRSAAVEVSYEDGEFILQTSGYGHGVGMSQYGAQQLALQGCTWQEIIRHYYTGVEIRQR